MHFNLHFIGKKSALAGMYFSVSVYAFMLSQGNQFKSLVETEYFSEVGQLHQQAVSKPRFNLKERQKCHRLSRDNLSHQHHLRKYWLDLASLDLESFRNLEVETLLSPHGGTIQFI